MRSAQAPSFLDARREASPLGRSLAAETAAGREWGKLHLIFKLARSLGEETSPGSLVDLEQNNY